MLLNFKGIISKMAVIIISGLTAICFFQHNKVEKLNKELSQTVNNYKYYQQLNSSNNKQQRTLQLKIKDLQSSNDSLLTTLDNTRKQLKIKKDNLQQAQVINTEMKDTTKVEILTKNIDFKEELKLNPLTTIIVERKDSILTTILDIKNQQILFVEETKEYRNKYKSWFQRLFKFDFKKDKVRKYQIHNSNPLIQVTDTRIIEIVK